MITGAHTILYSTDPEADRVFFRDVLKFPNVDAGEGWLIFGLPPSEIAVHPAGEESGHELYLMCDDIRAFATEMAGQAVACTEVIDAGWGLLCHIILPGGGSLGVYEPRHARPGNP